MKYNWIKPMVIGLSFIGLLGQTTQAQKLYVDFNVGYGLPVFGSTMFLTDQTTNLGNSPDEYSSTEKMVALSLGQGINFGVNVGYMAHKNIGFDLGLSYQIGSETEALRTRTEYDRNPSNPGLITTSNAQSYSSNMLYITPSLLLKTNLGKLSPYSKLGVAIGSGKIFHNEIDNYSDQTETTTEYYGGLAWGFEMSLGGAYSLNDKLSLYAEAYYRNMTYAPKKSTITSRTRNGEDIMDQISTEFKESEYFQKVTDENTVNDPDSPRKETLINFPFHSLGLKLGLRINL